METWVLILFAVSVSGGHPVVTNIDFTSETSCKSAASALNQEPLSKSIQGLGISLTGVCVPK